MWLDLANECLWRGDQALALRPKTFALLRYLVAHPGQLLTKAVLLEALWPETMVSEVVLAVRIRELRQVLGDTAHAPRFIETVHRRGYRFIGQLPTAPPAAPHPSAPTPLPRLAGRTRAQAGGPLDEPPVIPALPAPLSGPGAAQCRPTPESAAGERKVVTMLCCGLSETPTLRGADGLDTLHSLLRTLHAVVQGEVDRYGGIVQQVTSAHLLAAFGAPVAYEDHAQRAVLAALGIQQRVRGTSLATEALTVRIGLHTGLVAVGGLGDEAGSTLSIIGDVARLATLLQARATPGMPLCSAVTASLVRDIVCLEMAEPVPDAGQTTPVTTYQILGPHPQRRPAVGRGERSLSRFVGRAQELALLHTLLAQAETGRGQVIGLVGEPGMGKSRLLFEFRHHLRSKPVTSVAGECLSYGQATPYLPVLDMLRSLCGLTKTDSGATLVTKVQNAVQAAGLEAADWAPSLLHLLGVPTDTTGLTLPPPDVLKSRTFEALRQMILHRSQQQPLVITIDNLHWIDPTSEEYLASLVQHLAAAPLLLLVTYRPGYRPSWIDKSYATQLALQPLNAQDSRMLLQESLRSHPVPDALIDTLLRTAEGNPFFLEELAWMVVEQGVAAPTLAVPDTVQAVLAARIDRLPLEAKTLLQTAAVIGKEVPLSLLQAVTEQSEDILRHGLAQLQGAEFLYETRLFPEAEYTFKHALTHEVAYGGLLQERRRVLHGRIVEVLEAFAAEQVDRLAHHAVRGEVWDKAVTYCQQTGTRAHNRAAFREAATSFEQALQALVHLPEPGDTRRLAIDLRLAVDRPLVQLGEHRQRLILLGEAEILARALDDRARLGWVLARRAHVLRITGDHDGAMAVGWQAHELAAALGERAVQIQVSYHLGQTYYATGDFGRAAELLQWSVEAADRESGMPASGLQINSRAWLARTLSVLGAFAEGRRHGEEALRLATLAGRGETPIVAYGWLGDLYLAQGDLEHAIRVLEQGLVLCRASDNQNELRWIAAALGAALALQGRFTAGRALLEEAISVTIRTGAREFHSRWVAWLSEVGRLAGRGEEAWQHAHQALDLARQLKERGNEAHALHQLGVVHAHANHPDAAQAEMHYQQALALAEALGMRPLQAHCHLDLGTLYAQTGRREQARTTLATAIELYRAMDMAFWLPQAQALLEALA
jgi:class 3 adenylate cyclase/tetratricopeptide (TPR) repeat protein